MLRDTVNEMVAIDKEIQRLYKRKEKLILKGINQIHKAIQFQRDNNG